MDTPQSKIPMKEKQAVIDRFIEISGAKVEKYSMYMKHLNELLETFKLEDIAYTLEYLISHPPSKGFYSLRFVSYVLADAVASRDAQAILEQVEQAVERDIDVSTDEENEVRFNQINRQRKKFKGSVKF